MPARGATRDTPRLSLWRRAVGLVPLLEVAASFNLRRRVYLWAGLLPLAVGGSVALFGERAGLAHLEGGAAFVGFAGLCVAFLIYRCPACGCIPTSGLVLRPRACRKCGVDLHE